MADAMKRLSEEQTTRLRACTSDLKLPDQLDAEKNKCHVKGLLHPEGTYYKMWNILIHTLVMWSSFWTTLEFAFIPNPTAWILYFDGAVCLVFLVNIGLTFKAAYMCPKALRLVTSKHAIAMRYLRGGFLFDLLSSLPYNLVYYWAAGHPAGGALGYVFRGLPCLRLYRVAHFYSALARLGQSSRGVYFSIRIFKLVLNIVLASHFFAVAYFFLTLMEPDPANTWIGQGIGPDWQSQSVFLQYVAAMWWSIFVITSIGPAYTAVTTAEQIFCCFYALFGMAALAYTLGTLTMLMVKQESKTMKYHEDMASLKSYAVRTNLPDDLERQLKQQLRVQLQMHKSDATSFLSNVPHHLRVAVSRQLYLPIVENLEGFRLCSRPFLKQLVSEMDVETVMKNDIVTTEGDVATHLYICLSGRLAREDGPASAQPTVGSTFLTAGSVFGKTAVMCDVPQPFTVRALEHSQLLRLSKPAFATIAKSYPADYAVLLNALKQNMNNPSALCRTASEQAVSQGLGRLGPSRLGLRGTPEAGGSGSFAQLESIAVEGGETDMVASACAAASTGRVDKLQALFAEAPEIARAADYNGRTPLHVAAAYGHVTCVSFLVQQSGVNVNAIDRGGSTPMLEAVKNNHLKAAEALKSAGALLLLRDPGATLCRITSSACAAAAAPPVDSSAAAAGGAAAALPGASPSPAAAAAPCLSRSASGRADGGLRSVFSRSNSIRAGRSTGGGGSTGNSGNGSLEYLLRLLDAGVDVNAQDYAGCSALHVACANRSVVVAKLLMSHGADPHLEDVSGNTPFDLAQATGLADLVNAIEGTDGAASAAAGANAPGSPNMASLGGRCGIMCLGLPGGHHQQQQQQQQQQSKRQSASQFEAVEK